MGDALFFGVWFGIVPGSVRDRFGFDPLLVHFRLLIINGDPLLVRFRAGRREGLVTSSPTFEDVKEHALAYGFRRESGRGVRTQHDRRRSTADVQLAWVAMRQFLRGSSSRFHAASLLAG